SRTGPAPRAGLVAADLGSDAAVADATFPRRDVRRTRARPVGEADERLRVRSHPRGRDRGDPCVTDASAGPRRSFVGGDGGARPRRRTTAVTLRGRADRRRRDGAGGTSPVGGVQGADRTADARGDASDTVPPGAPALVPRSGHTADRGRRHVADARRRARRDPSPALTCEPFPDPSGDLGTGPSGALSQAPGPDARDPRRDGPGGVGRVEASRRARDPGIRRPGPRHVDPRGPRPPAATSEGRRRSDPAFRRGERLTRAGVRTRSSYALRMIVLLFLLLLAALAGVLGLVLKITIVIVLTAILSIGALIAIASFGLRHQMRNLQRGGATAGTTIPTGRPARDLPSRDGRY